MKIRLDSGVKTKPFRSGLIAGCISIITYLFVVIMTTPNLPPLTALGVAIKINGIIIFGLAITIGIQIYLSHYAKSLGCATTGKRKALVASSGSTALSSFFSFFSLVPLGCCGSWLLILSFLPSIIGSSLSVMLIQHSKLLSFLGLLIVIGYTGFSAFKLYKKLKSMRFQVQRRISSM